MKKLIMTGFADLVVGNEATSKRADGFFIKLIKPRKLSEIIEQKLYELTRELDWKRALKLNSALIAISTMLQNKS
jgi:hypothetical protein